MAALAAGTARYPTGALEALEVCTRGAGGVPEQADALNEKVAPTFLAATGCQRPTRAPCRSCPLPS